MSYSAKRSRAFVELLHRRLVILDGAMGTMIQRHRLSEAHFRGARFADNAYDLLGNMDVLSLTQPHIVTAIHQQYLQAGADVISTNTFNGTRVSQARYGLSSSVDEMNETSARLARAAADTAFAATGIERFVAGVVGPTGSSVLPPEDSHACTMAYAEACGALVRGGVDALLIETVVDPHRAQAALEAARETMAGQRVQLPIIVSVVIDEACQLISGHTLEIFWRSIRAAQPAMVGFNCVAADRRLRAPLEALAQMADCGICLYPSAGLPDPAGVYDKSVSSFTEPVYELARDGLLNMVGGCCGTTPEFIRSLAGAVQGLASHTYQGVGL